MHTLLATFAGLLLLGVVVILARWFGLNTRTSMMVFTALWLLASIGHGAMGIAAGQTVLTEVVVWMVVFGVPIGAMLAVLPKLTTP